MQVTACVWSQARAYYLALVVGTILLKTTIPIVNAFSPSLLMARRWFSLSSGSMHFRMDVRKTESLNSFTSGLDSRSRHRGRCEVADVKVYATSSEGEVPQAEDETSTAAEMAEDTSEASAEKEKKEPEEPPEVTSLKEEIASLENTLKSKRRDAMRLRDEADEYTENGYMRKCAEMDNIRKRRDIAFANDKYVARATVVQKFLPVLDEMNELADVKYAGNEFAKQYVALRNTLRNRFEKELEVTDFNANVGAKIDLMRCTVVSEEYNEDYERGIVIRALSPGLEVRGNVIRFAECVISKGSEAEARAKAEAEARTQEEANIGTNSEAESNSEAEAEAEAEAESDA